MEGLREGREVSRLERKKHLRIILTNGRNTCTLKITKHCLKLKGDPNQ